MRQSIIVFTGIILSFLVESTFAQEIREVGHCDTPGDAIEVAVSAEHAYIADGGGGLCVIDISDPESPEEIGDFNTRNALGVSVVNDVAFVTDGESGFYIIDISDPVDPSEIAHYDMPEGTYDVTIVEDYAYIANGQSGLRLIDISDLENPEEVGSYDTPGIAFDVGVIGNYAYVADGDIGVQIIDISDPENPESIGTHDTPGCAYTIDTEGDLLYVADWQGGVRVINVSDPENPEEVGIYDTPDLAFGVTVVRKYAFIADRYTGIVAIDFLNTSNPDSISSFDTPGNALGVTVEGNYAYIAESQIGLLILDISEFFYPDISVQERIDFGIVAIENETEESFYIFNRGDNLEIDDISVDGDYFTIEFEDSLVVEPLDSVWVNITFVPEEEGVFDGTLTITSNDPDDGEVTIDLIGIGNELTIIHVPEDYETIQAAIDTAMAGDTVQVAPGEYFENINFNGKNIVVRGNIDEPSETIIDGGENGSVVTFQNGETSSARLTGFTICNGTGNEVEDLTFGGGVFCSSNANPTLDHSIIKDNTATYGGGIYCDSSEDQIIHKVALSGNSATRAGGGLYFSNGTGLILNNLSISSNQCASGAGIWLGNETEMQIINTIVWGNEGVEIYVYGQEDVNTLTIAYTDIEGGIEGIAVNDNCEVHWNEGNINADPLFIDADSDNLHLTADSPCIDAGNPESPLDPDSTRADIGAYYYHQEVSVPPDFILHPSAFILNPAYPNPFNSTTSISYSLDRDGFITLKLYDLSGREVASLVNERQSAGYYRTIWNAGGLPSGVYLLRLNDGVRERTTKLVLIR